MLEFLLCLMSNLVLDFSNKSGDRVQVRFAECVTDSKVYIGHQKLCYFLRHPSSTVDSAAISIIEVILVELTNTVFVNSTNYKY